MKFTFMALCSLLVAQLAIAENTNQVATGSLAYLDTIYGFRDLKFEQSIETCKGMSLLEDDGDVKFYNRKDEGLELGGAKLKAIEYKFYKGKLANVVLTAAGEAEATSLLKALTTDYGPARKSPRGANKLYWFGQKVLVDYMMTGNGSVSVGMWSKPMQALQQVDKEKNK